MVRSSGLSHIGYMKKDPPNRIAEIRKARGLTQQALAEKVGRHWITISKLERGEMQMTGQWMTTLAEALDVQEADLLRSYLSEHKLPIAGAFSSSILTVFDETHSVSVASPPDQWAGAWIEVMDHTLGPFFSKGDFLRFRVIANEAARHLVNRVVMAQSPSFSTIGVLEKETYAGPVEDEAGRMVEGAIDVEIRGFSGVKHNFAARDLYVFDGCHVFWKNPQIAD